MNNCTNPFSRMLVALALAVSLAILAQPVLAQTAGGENAAPVKAAAIGKVVSCAVCHGPQGEGNTLMSAPRIGGLAEWYLARQMHNFRQGIRGGSYEDHYGTQMRALALTLELDHAGEIEELARYFATLEPDPAPETIEGDPERGKQLYAVCSACHGEDGSGNRQMNAPALAGQHDWYLMRQMTLFSNGLRGANADDTWGQQMVPIMQTLSDEQAMMDVVAYINSL